VEVKKSASAGAMLSVHAGLRLHGDYEAVRNFGLARSSYTPEASFTLRAKHLA
jgi:hypothetical protein